LSYAKSLFTGFRAGCFSFFLAVGSVPLAVSRIVPVFPVWDGLFHGLDPATGIVFLAGGTALTGRKLTAFHFSGRNF